MGLGRITLAVWWLVAVLLVAAHLLLIWQFDQLPYLDLPNHLTRAFILGKLFQGDPAFLSEFSFQFVVKPYLLGDMLLTFIVNVLPLDISQAGRLWLSICYIALPFGSYVYARTIKAPNSLQVLLLVCSSFLATHWFFLSSFCNYSLGSGLFFLLLAAYDRWLTDSSTKKYLLYVACVALAYFLHLSTFLFSGTAVAIIAFSRWGFRDISFKRLVVAGLPYVPFCILRFITTYGESPLWKTRPLEDKLIALGSMGVRFFAAVDIFLIFSFFTIILLLAIGFRREKNVAHEEKKRSVEFGFVMAAIGLWYLALPVEIGPAYDIDVRALPFMTVFLLLFSFYFGKRAGDNIWAVQVGAVMLALVNAGYLFHFLDKHNSYLEHYNQAIAKIPAGHKVLPIATRGDEGRIQTNLHTAELYMTQTPPGFVPFVFSSNNAVGIIDYFSYKNHPYGPNEKWYLDGKNFDWDKAKADYDFIVVSRPYEDRRIELSKQQLHFKNKAAVVYDVRAVSEPHAGSEKEPERRQDS